MMSNRQAGFTALEIAVVFLIILIAIAAVIPGIALMVRDAKADASIEQARTILQVCEIARTKIATSSVDARGRYSHTYNVIPSWSDTSVLQNQLDRNYQLPALNPLGTKILVRSDAQRCYVAVDLTFQQDGYGGNETTTIGGKTRVIVTARPRSLGTPVWILHQKRILHDEVTQ